MTAILASARRSGGPFLSQSSQSWFAAPCLAHHDSNGARLGRTQAMEEISLCFCSRQNRVLGEDQQLPWLLG